MFQQYLPPKGELAHRGRMVKPELITDIGLLTVEGENDDISGIGQTQAAHTLCSGLPDAFKADYVVAHECAHLLELNHGPKFWAHVSALVGDEKPYRAWLRAEGARLHAFGT